MVGLVKLVGIAMLVAGVVNFVKPLSMKKMASYFMNESRIKTGGIISIVIGLIFLRAAGRCSLPWVVVMIGLLSIAKGVLGLTLEKKKFQVLLNWLHAQQPKTLRKLTLVSIAIGVALIYAA